MLAIEEKLEKLDFSGASAVSPVHWVEDMQIVLANGDIYSFDERPYLIDPLTSRARLKCIRKGRGLGFSETFILKSIHGLDKGVFKQGVQYVFPTETAMREFVQSRFNVVIKRNHGLKMAVHDTDTTYYKRVGEGNLYMNGGILTTAIEGQQKESMAFRGKHVDMEVIDELDVFELANNVIGLAEGNLANSKVKMMVAIANPTVSNYGIDRLFQKSNQMFWYRECKSCGELTCPDKEFPKLIDKDGCHCFECGGLLGWRGKWIPDRPERDDLYGVRSKDWEGYHISALHNPNSDPYSIAEAFKDKSESNQEKLHKFQLGLPYDAKSNSLTLTEMYDCCSTNREEYENSTLPTFMGMDVGPSSGHHVVIGIKTAKDRYRIYHVNKLQSFEDAIVLGTRFNVKTCVCDMDPESTSARRFQKKAGFRVWLNRYNWSNPLEEVAWNEDDRTIKTYRNYIFDESHRVIAESRVELPMRSRKIEEFAKQYIQPFKTKKEGKQGISYIYRSRSQTDHYRNAMNYFLTASYKSRITRPEGYKNAKPKYVKNSKERYI
jgi:hypothetical protein